MASLRGVFRPIRLALLTVCLVGIAAGPGAGAAGTDEQIKSAIIRGEHKLIRVYGSRRPDGDFNTTTYIARVPCGGGPYRFRLARTYLPTNSSARVTYRLRAGRVRVQGHAQRCGRRLRRAFGKRRVSILLRRTTRPHTWMKLTGRRTGPSRFDLRLRIRRLPC